MASYFYPSFMSTLLCALFVIQTLKFSHSKSLTNVSCIDAEREALLKFKQDLTDPLRRLGSWTSEGCCEWEGIECCEKTGHVSKLDLRNPCDGLESCNVGGYSEDASSYSNGLHPVNSSLVVCFGEILMDFVPIVPKDPPVEEPVFKAAPGGAPANVAVGISKLGGSAAFIGKVGEDAFGHMLTNILEKYNVDNSGVRFDHNARTALAFVTNRADGEREFLFYHHRTADMLLHESELHVELISKARIFHYGSISLIDEPCKSAHLAAMKIAKNSGAILSYDPNLREALWPTPKAAREGMMSVWDQSDIIKISEEEIKFLTGDKDPNDNVVMEKLFHSNLKLLIVTEGPKGCRYFTKEFSGRVPGIKEKAVDTTGAGDAFVGGMLYCLASELTIYKDEERLKEALVFANACGAFTVTKRGAISALPTKEEALREVAKAAL